VLDDEEVGGGVRGGGFERKRTEAQGVEMSGAVLAGGDGMERGPGGAREPGLRGRAGLRRGQWTRRP